MDITQVLLIAAIGTVAYMTWMSSKKQKAQMAGYGMGPTNEILKAKSILEYRYTPGLETESGSGRACVQLEDAYDSDTSIGPLV